MKNRILSFLMFTAALVLLESCSTVPLTGRKQFVAIPSSQMLSLSADSYSQVLESSRLSSNQYYVNTVREVGVRLTAAVEEYMKMNNLESAIEGYDWQYNVIVSEELNA